MLLAFFHDVLLKRYIMFYLIFKSIFILGYYAEQINILTSSFLVCLFVFIFFLLLLHGWAQQAKLLEQTALLLKSF